MPTVETTLAFFGVALLLSFTPGPDNLFVLMQSATQGRRAGLLVVLGLSTGLVVHTAAVALGLAAVFAASATAFTVLKSVGAAYLAYLAWKTFRSPVGDDETPTEVKAAGFRLYLRGVVMNLTNPKVLLFFLAFLPQFVDPQLGPVAPQVAWFGVTFIVATLLAFSTIAQLAGYFGRKLRGSARAQRLMNRIAATVYGGLAARLVTTAH